MRNAQCIDLWLSCQRKLHFIAYYWFASDVPVPGQEKKHFSLLGNVLYFDANLAEKFLLY